MAGSLLLKLLPPDLENKFSLNEAILKRRSQRKFIERDLTLKEISALLWAAQGVTAKEEGGYTRRAVPSAGAAYPLEIYLISRDGFFQYLPAKNCLKNIQKDDLREKLSEAAGGQNCVKEASAVIILTVVFFRATSKYSQRGVRYAHFEAGHAAQNLHLEAVALGLGSVAVGAFDDRLIKTILNLPQGEEPLYLIPVGAV